MSSGKAPATPQESNTSPAPQSTQQQPPKAPMSYSRAAKSVTPALPKSGNSSLTAQNQASSKATGLSAQASAFQPPPSLSTLSIAETHQPTTKSAITAQSTPTANSGPSKVPVNISPDSSASAAAHNDASSDQKSKDSKQEQPEKLRFFDESYAADAGQGIQGAKFKIRVNRFTIVDNGSIKKLYVYNVNFPPMNGRELKNASVRKQLMHQVVSARQAWGQSVTAHEVFTDWKKLIITKKPLEDLSTPALRRGNGNNGNFGPILAGFQFNNQSSQATPYTGDAVIDLVGSPLDVDQFRNYIRGRPTQPVNFDFSPFIQAFNILVRHFAANDADILRSGSSRIFPRHPDRTLPSSGFLVRLGVFNSFRPANNSWQLQLNTSAAAFFPETRVIDFLQKRFGNRVLGLSIPNAQLSAQMIPEIRGLLKGLQVQYLYTPSDGSNQANSQIHQRPQANSRTKHITGLGDPASTQQLPNNGLTVQAHFDQNVLQGRLRYPNLPVVNTGGDARSQTQIWIPMELLWIVPDQALSSTVPRDDMDAMGNFSRLTPINSVSHIQGQTTAQGHNAGGGRGRFGGARGHFGGPRGRGQTGQGRGRGVDRGRGGSAGRGGFPGQGANAKPPLMVNGQGLTLINDVNLRLCNVLDINPDMLQITGRKLTAPRLVYYNNLFAEDNAKGRWNLTDRKFYDGAHLGKLLIIRVGEATGLNDKLLKSLQHGLIEYGVDVSLIPLDKSQAHAASVRPDDLSKAFNKLYEMNNGDAKPKVILAILENDSNDNYAMVKWWGDRLRGVQTVCLTNEKVRELLKPGFTANIALKFNAKLGGKNHVLTSPAYSRLHGNTAGGTMVVGADVTHPGPASIQYCPSIAGVVASTDKYCVSFPGSMRLQAGRTEQIIDLRAMMVERLNAWRHANKTLPNRILFYRDGVGEDQFPMVKRYELPAIKAACAEVEPAFAPPVTLIVCTKRQATRFYPVQDDISHQTAHSDPKGHFKPGLVVDDSSIRLPRHFDFWLQAHQPLQGTGRPCHYFVIENGIGFTPDELQQITFDLSWVYATSVTPVSVVGPAYYADKLCERGRCYLRPLLIGKHSYRPTKTVHDSWLQGLPGYANMTDDETRQTVAGEIAAGHYPTNTPVALQAFRLWNQGGNENPCGESVKENMFYI